MAIKKTDLRPTTLSSSQASEKRASDKTAKAQKPYSKETEQLAKSTFPKGKQKDLFEEGNTFTHYTVTEDDLKKVINGVDKSSRWYGATQSSSRAYTEEEKKDVLQKLIQSGDYL